MTAHPVVSDPACIRSRPNLVIVTTHFGYHFSGGSTATCEIFKHLQDEFDHITVIGTDCADHPFSRLTFLRHKHSWQAISLIKQHNTSDTIFYGDFYNAWMLAALKTRYFFTYHDNWPEQSQLSLKNRIKAFWIWPLYRYIFKHAQAVFTVSEFKWHAIKPMNRRTLLVRNGFRRSVPPALKNHPQQPARRDVVMAGNIDQRKYQQALPVFDRLLESQIFMNSGTTIAIYGHTTDKGLTEKLQRYPFVSVMGHHNAVPFHQYAVMLHTSVMENLSLAWCEALYHGNTIVSFNVGGAKEVIDTDEGHYLIDPMDTDAMATSLIDAIMSPKPVRDMTQSLNNFDWELAATAYSDTMLPATRPQVNND